jgi:predicted GNAT superfamily acetyltransferase
MMLTSNSALGEFPELYYVLVEDAENRGLHGSSLADALVTRKNAEWTVTVELDFTPEQVAALDGDGEATTVKSVRFEGCASIAQVVTAPVPSLLTSVHH